MKTKLYRGLHIDVGLDTKILDRLNSNRNIQIISTCSGHNIKGRKYPSLSFRYYGNLTNKQLLNILKNIPNTRISYSSIEELNKFNRKYNLPLEDQSIFYIKGTIKGTLTWWRNVANIVSKIR